MRARIICRTFPAAMMGSSSLVALLLAVAGRVRGGSARREDPAASVLPARYQRLAQDQIWALDDGFAPCPPPHNPPTKADKQCAHAHPGVAHCLAGAHTCAEGLQLAAAHAKLGEITGNQTEFKAAARLLGVYATYWANASAEGTRPFAGTWDFFQCYPVVYAYRALLSHGGAEAAGLPRQEARWLQGAAADICQPQMLGVFNQPLSRVLGTTLAVQTWSTQPFSHKTWTEYIDAVWNGWMADQSYTENSPVYNSIFLMNLLEFAELRNVTAAQLATPELRQTLEKYRDLVGPASTLSSMPSFGDSWPGAGLPCLKPGCTERDQWTSEDATFWVAVFERAAVLCNDGSFRTAAAAYFRITELQNAGAAYRPDAKHAFWLLRAYEWAQAAEIPATPRLIKTAVLTRRAPGNPAAIDKLMLVGDGKTAARPLMLQEAWGDTMSHCHSMQKGAILYYGAENHTFLKQQGRDNHMPEQASIFMAWEDPDEGHGQQYLSTPTPTSDEPLHMPFRRPRDTMLDHGEFQLLELPTRHMAQPGLKPEQFYQRTFYGLSFMLNRRSVNVSDLALVDSLYLGDIAMVAANGSAFQIDDFSGGSNALASWSASVHDLPHGWLGPKRANLSLVEYRAGNTGLHALRVDAPGAGHVILTFNGTTRFPGPAPRRVFNTQEFTHLRLRWKLAKDGAYVRRNDGAIFSVDTGPYVSTQPFPSFGTTGSSNNDFNARQGVGGGSGYANAGKPGWSNTVIANDRFWPDVTGAVTATKGDDHYGSSNVTGVHTAGGVWRRETVLLSEGALIVLDTFAPAVRVTEMGWTAGPIWHMNIEQAPVPCTNRTESAGDLCYVAAGFNLTDQRGGVTRGNLSLAVAMASDGLNCSVGQGFLIGKNVNPFAIYGRRSLHSCRAAGRPARILSVLMPFSASARTDVGNGLRLDCTDVSVLCVAKVPLQCGGVARVAIGAGGWEVTRS